MVRSVSIVRPVFVLSAAMAISACGGGPAGPSTSLTGMWGGDHIALTVADTGSHVEFDCAHGDIPGPLTADIQNAFSVSGTFGRDTGGPVRIGQVPDSHPAVYFGSVTAPMSLTAPLRTRPSTLS